MRAMRPAMPDQGVPYGPRMAAGYVPAPEMMASNGAPMAMTPNQMAYASQQMQQQQPNGYVPQDIKPRIVQRQPRK